MQRLKVALGQADVGRLALHMQRALGDAIAVGGKAGVGLGRAVAGDQLEGLLAVHPPAQSVEQVEELPVHLPDLAAAPVAQHVVQPRSEEHTSELQSLMRSSYAV